MQGRDRDADVENELIDTVGWGESGANGESSTDICALPCGEQTAGEHREPSPELCDDLGAV